jgi:hypothetical protein
VVRTGPCEAAVRLARTCYEHFAGRLGVSIADAMLNCGQIEMDQDGGIVTERGGDFLKRFAVAITPTAKADRLFCRPCLDARSAVRISAARCAWRWPVIVLKLGRDKRIAGTRAVAITQKGRQGVQHAFGFRLEH